MPSPELPDITFRVPAVVPPIVLLLRTNEDARAVAKGAAPVTSVPM